jgi:hypothetical protein
MFISTYIMLYKNRQNQKNTGCSYSLCALDDYNTESYK